jgi:RES domain-containing protein
LTLYRICRSKYPENDGEGARLTGGRWNHKGIPVIYCSATTSLCALEVLAHASGLPADMVYIEVELPDSLSIQTIEVAALPPDWNAPVHPSSTKDIGAKWVRENKTAILSPPSAVIPHERNYLLNPKHPDFSRIRFRKPVPFKFDPRLK